MEAFFFSRPGGDLPEHDEPQWRTVGPPRPPPKPGEPEEIEFLEPGGGVRPPFALILQFSKGMCAITLVVERRWPPYKDERLLRELEEIYNQGWEHKTLPTPTQLKIRTSGLYTESWHNAGVTYIWDLYSGRTSSRDLLFPIWMLAAIPGVFSLLCWIAYCRLSRRQYRLKNNLCMKCGYDLRASEERCPECGKPIGIIAISAPGAR
jgi:hypothetical protein